MSKDDRKTCQATTKRGQKCKNPARPGTDFCHSHSSMHSPKVKWYANSKVHLFVAVLSLVLAIYLFQVGPSKDLQEHTYEITEEINENVRSLMEETDRFCRNNEDRLMLDYPFGYIVFLSNHQEQILPYKSFLKANYVVDWSTASIKQEEGYFTLKVPTMMSKNGVIFSSSNLVMATYETTNLPVMRFGEVTIVLEVVAKERDYLAIILGYQRTKK